MGHADCRAGLAIIFQRYDMRQYDNVSMTRGKEDIRLTRKFDGKWKICRILSRNFAIDNKFSTISPTFVKYWQIAVGQRFVSKSYFVNFSILRIFYCKNPFKLCEKRDEFIYLNLSKCRHIVDIKRHFHVQKRPIYLSVDTCM